MLRTGVLAGAVGAGLAVYFILSLSVLPQSYQTTIQPGRPEPIITDASISTTQIKLGETFTISVEGTNIGDQADMQIVSVAFPNFTTTDNVKILRNDFRQTPFFVKAGDEIGSQYLGDARPVIATYASIEAYSWPWERGSAYSITLEVKPNTEGRFVVFVKSIALPHTWDGAHYPREGTIDYQKEFVQIHSIQVTKI